MVLKYLSEWLKEWLSSAVRGWSRFWFTPADPATLGLVRFFAGSMLFYTHLVWSLDLIGFFGAEGRLPADFSRRFQDSPFAWSHLNFIESPALLWTTHIAALVVLGMLALGLFTRVTSVLGFLILVSYAHRLVGAQFGLDQINGLLAFYLMIGPAGDAFSLDRLLKRRAGQGSQTAKLEPAAPSVSANIAIRLMQCHMCIVYLFAGAGKLFGESWWDGTAMWGAFANYEYQSIDMTFLAAHPLLVHFLTHLTIAWECSYAALVWPKWTRPIVIALAVPLHMGIALAMGMMTFGLAMLIGNLAFVSPQLVRAIFDRRPSENIGQSRAGQGGAPAAGM
jgi:hypothetical protein